MFVENMEFECDVLVWNIFVKYGLTCEIVCKTREIPISGKRVKS